VNLEIPDKILIYGEILYESSMTDIGVTDALQILTTEDPSYEELVDIYNELRKPVSQTDESVVSARALAQIIREFIDYLDFISSELEKSIGLSRLAERKRLLDSLEEPHGTTVEVVSAFIQQWESVERYTEEDISAGIRT
jgi:hypothetical protein